VSLYRELQIVLAVVSTLIMLYVDAVSILNNIENLSVNCSDSPRKRKRALDVFRLETS
jgi:hypothetical protein